MSAVKRKKSLNNKSFLKLFRIAAEFRYIYQYI